MATTADLLPPDPQVIDGNPGAGRVGVDADWNPGPFGTLTVEPLVFGASRAQVTVLASGFDDDPPIEASVELTLGDLIALRDYATLLIGHYADAGDDGEPEDEEEGGGLTDARWHEVMSERLDPEAFVAAIDAKYHDHLPEGATCPACDLHHASIHPD